MFRLLSPGNAAARPSHIPILCVHLLPISSRLLRFRVVLCPGHMATRATTGIVSFYRGLAMSVSPGRPVTIRPTRTQLLQSLIWPHRVNGSCLMAVIIGTARGEVQTKMPRGGQIMAARECSAHEKGAAGFLPWRPRDGRIPAPAEVVLRAGFTVHASRQDPDTAASTLLGLSDGRPPGPVAQTRGRSPPSSRRRRWSP